MATTVFISRYLGQNSAFLSLLRAEGIWVQGESLLKFAGVEDFELPQADWLFFYSSKAVCFLAKNTQRIPKGVRCAVLGKSAERALQSYFDYEADFVGTGVPQETTDLFVAEAGKDQVAFLQAEHSRASVQKAAGKRLNASAHIVYRNEMRSFEKPIWADIVVLTSPMNARSFIRSHGGQLPTMPLVVIGRSTAKQLRQLGFSKQQFQIAEEPREESLAEAVLELIASKQV